MYISLFWIIAIVLIIAYFQYKRKQQLLGIAELLSAAEKAGVTAASADKFVDDFAFWVGEIPQQRDLDAVIFALYDQYRLPRPGYAVIEDALKEKMKNYLRVHQYELRKYKRDRTSYYESLETLEY